MKSILQSLNINPRIIDAALTANLDVLEKILTLSIPELIRLTNLSEKDVFILIHAVSHVALKSQIVNAFQLYERNCPQTYQYMTISTGCKSIDNILNGGIVTRTITEITGESSSGKTQLCLQLSLRAQLPHEYGGIKSGVGYICTEQSFPIKRFSEIVNNFQVKYPSFEGYNFLDDVFIAQIGDLASMWNYLRQNIPALLIGRNIKLIIIDSIAALFRSEYDMHDHNKRVQDLQNFGVLLKKLIDQFGIAVLCVNQVTSVLEGKTQLGMDSGVKPSLGLCWSDFVTTRLALSRTVHPFEMHSLRSLKVMFSPYLPISECKFSITSEGLKEVEL